jgi:DNA repair protein RecO
VLAMAQGPELSRSAFMERGVILRTQPLRESDLLVAILGNSRGKLSAVARGANRSKRRFSGGLQLFDCGLFSLSAPKHRFPERRDRHEIFTLNEISDREIWRGLSSNLDRFQAAALVLEASDFMTHEGDSGGANLYSALIQTLRSIDLAADRENCTAAVNEFLFFCLRDAGLDPLASPDCPEKIRVWSSSSQIVADSRLSTQVMLHLCRYIQESAGRALKTLPKPS